jgi:hypothetical protein
MSAAFAICLNVAIAVAMHLPLRKLNGVFIPGLGDSGAKSAIESVHIAASHPAASRKWTWATICMVSLFGAASLFSNQLLFTLVSPLLLYAMRAARVDSFIALMMSINVALDLFSLALGVALQLIGAYASTEWAGFLLTTARVSVRSLSLSSGCATFIYALSL